MPVWQLSVQYGHKAYQYPEFEKSLKFYISLCEMLSLKADFGLRLMEAYETQNTGELKRIVEEE
ncbi:MAG: hypothetical protein IJO50_02900, partial [Clostridia bacterium]|nr:hypothetical protein [Clostridia bacterium]